MLTVHSSTEHIVVGLRVEERMEVTRQEGRKITQGRGSGMCKVPVVARSTENSTDQGRVSEARAGVRENVEPDEGEAMSRGNLHAALVALL